MNYTTISISGMREQLPDIAERVARTGEIFAVEKWGKIKGYFVPSLAMAKNIDTEEELLARRKITMKKYAGVWKDRDEMKHPVEWVTKLRKKESNRYGKIFN